MNKYVDILENLLTFHDEYEWLDFKENWFSKDEIGEYISAISSFEFPRVNLQNYELSEIEDETFYCGKDSNNEVVTALIYSGGYFSCALTQEEINILATYMIVEWLGQQLASVENTRMKYSGDDFKFTSQANHMNKILQVKKDYERQGFHLQRLYKRRKADENGIMRSTFGSIMDTSS